MDIVHLIRDVQTINAVIRKILNQLAQDFGQVERRLKRVEMMSVGFVALFLGLALAYLLGLLFGSCSLG